MKQQGKVWLVGAGPGDLSLFTLKGKTILEQAQVVLYDNLVSPDILSLIPSNAQRIDVGKRAGNHPIPQEEINHLLLQKAQQGLRVVRLKGGDPFLFGRGGEELMLLTQHQIPFEVVPGVSSALAVPACTGIPVTHRGLASSVHIITGHKQQNQPTNLDFPILAKLQGTLVFLMGLSELETICTGLQNAGMPGTTPAAVISRGSTAHQQQILSDLQTLPQQAANANLQPPAIIVIGAVCTLAEHLHWKDLLPLSHSHILVTRPRTASSTLAQQLRQYGAQVTELPAIAIESLPDTAALHRQLQTLHTIHWIAFTSPTAVSLFFDHLKSQRIDVRTLTHMQFAAVGPATQAAIEAYGIFTAYTPPTYNAHALLQGLAKIVQPNQTVLLPRAQAGVPLPPTPFPLIDLPIYRTIPQALLSHSTIDATAVAFASASAVNAFCRAIPLQNRAHLTAYCIGPQTAAQAKTNGFASCITAPQATISALVQTIVQTETTNKGV